MVVPEGESSSSVIPAKACPGPEPGVPPLPTLPAWSFRAVTTGGAPSPFHPAADHFNNTKGSLVHVSTSRQALPQTGDGRGLPRT
jgi:hypothetical protein